MMQDAYVEGEIMRRKQLESFDELRANAEFRIGLRLNEPSDAP
jgi:hypothetical protein